MGICTSCDATSVATAKLILQNGELQEFSYPVKVSYLLQRYPSCFICNSDDMEFDGFVSAIREEEELVPGQLYFALPLSRLRYPLQAEEMAALAVKASLALMKIGNVSSDIYGCSVKGGNTMVVSGYQGKERRRLSCDGGANCGARKSRSKCSKGSGRNFASALTAIPE